MKSTETKKIQEFRIAVALMERIDLSKKNMALLHTYAVILNLNLINNGISSDEQSKLMKEAFSNLSEKELCDVRQAAELFAESQKMLFNEKYLQKNN